MHSDDAYSDAMMQQGASSTPPIHLPWLEDR